MSSVFYAELDYIRFTGSSVIRSFPLFSEIGPDDEYTRNIFDDFLSLRIEPINFRMFRIRNNSTRWQTVCGKNDPGVKIEPCRSEWGNDPKQTSPFNVRQSEVEFPVFFDYKITLRMAKWAFPCLILKALHHVPPIVRLLVMNRRGLVHDAVNMHGRGLIIQNAATTRE